MVLVHIALSVATLIFGVHYVVAKATMAVVPPLALLCFRVSIPMIVFHAASWSRKGPSGLRRGDGPKLIVLAVLGVILNQALFLMGLELSTPINASVLMTTIPVTTITFALLLRRETFAIHKVAGIFVAFVGALFLVGILQFDFSSAALFGNLLILGNSCSYGLFLVLSRNILRRCSTVSFMAWIFTIGTVGIIPFGAREVLSLDIREMGVEVWLGVAYIVFFASLLAHFLNGWSLKRAPSSTVGIYVLLQPVIATTCSVVFLGEELRGTQVIAAAFIFAGVYLGAFRRPRM